MIVPTSDTSSLDLLLTNALEDLDKSRKKAEKEYGRLASDEVKYLRDRSKTDLFFLVHGILGYNRLSPRLHGNFCEWIENTRYERFRLKLMPRAHFKTTVDTIGESIQSVLPDDKGGLHYPYNLSGDCRILLGHEVHEMAQRFLFEITGHFVANPSLMGLFPELIPDPKRQRINKSELELPRRGHWAEPTIDTIGVGGRGQGRHYDRIKLDDIFGEKSRDSKAERDATIQWFDNIQAFFVSLAKSHLDVVGTRYSLDDVYSHMMTVYKGRLVRYIRRIREVNPLTDKIEPIFPEEITEDDLVVLQKNRKIWTAQYVNDPQEGLAEFNDDWLRYYNVMPGRKIALFEGDSQAKTIIDEKDLDRIIIFDPAVSGEFGLVVTGTDNKRIFVLEQRRDHLSPPEQLNMLFKLVMRWNPRLVAIEEVTFSALYQDWLKREMVIRNFRFNVVPVKPRKLGTGRLSKTERIKVLAPYFSSGQIFIQEGMTDFIDEYHIYGASEKIHILDAMAYGPELWNFAFSRQRFEKYAQLEKDLLAQRDQETGYSKI